MTTEQKDRVAQLRTEGKGYKRIGEMLGISVSTVKSYC
ncbi:MAG: sigma factor-like helix-turn-helix DNA-binding protein [Clostridia bacterium]